MARQTLLLLLTALPLFACAGSVTDDESGAAESEDPSIYALGSPAPDEQAARNEDVAEVAPRVDRFPGATKEIPLLGKEAAK